MKSAIPKIKGHRKKRSASGPLFSMSSRVNDDAMGSVITETIIGENPAPVKGGG